MEAAVQRPCWHAAISALPCATWLRERESWKQQCSAHTKLGLSLAARGRSVAILCCLDRVGVSILMLAADSGDVSVALSSCEAAALPLWCAASEAPRCPYGVQRLRAAPTGSSAAAPFVSAFR